MLPGGHGVRFDCAEDGFRPMDLQTLGHRVRQLHNVGSVANANNDKCPGMEAPWQPDLSGHALILDVGKHCARLGSPVAGPATSDFRGCVPQQTSEACASSFFAGVRFRSTENATSLDLGVIVLHKKNS